MDQLAFSFNPLAKLRNGLHDYSPFNSPTQGPRFSSVDTIRYNHIPIQIITHTYKLQKHSCMHKIYPVQNQVLSSQCDNHVKRALK